MSNTRPNDLKKQKTSTAASTTATVSSTRMLLSSPLFEPQQQQQQQSTITLNNSTDSSDVEVDARKISGIFVSYSIQFDQLMETFNIKFVINSGQRPDSLLQGGSQGDHTTSYVAVLEAMLASTDGLGIRDASNSMKIFGENILTDNDANIFIKITPNIKLVPVKGKREEVTSTLKNENFFDGETVKMIDLALKHSKIHELCNYLCAMATHILISLQKQPHATVFSNGRVDKNSSEGSDAKSAARALITLDMMCQIVVKGESEYTENMAKLASSLSIRKKDSNDTEDDHVARYGLNAFYRKLGETSVIDANSITVMDYETFTNFVATLLRYTNIIAEFINTLLDYQRVIQFNVDDMNIKVEKVDDSKKTILESKQEKGISILKNQFTDNDNVEISLTNERNITVARTSFNDLIAILRRHLTIIEFAFPNLIICLKKNTMSSSDNNNDNTAAANSTSLYENVLKFFLINFTNNQGWNNYEYFDLATTQQKMLDPNNLSMHLKKARDTNDDNTYHP